MQVGTNVSWGCLVEAKHFCWGLGLPRILHRKTSMWGRHLLCSLQMMMDDVFTCFCLLVCTICSASINALQLELMQVGANKSWGCLVEAKLLCWSLGLPRILHLKTSI